MQETRVRSLGLEDPLEKEMATHSSTIAWKIPGMEKPGRLQSMVSQRVDTTERLHFHFLVFMLSSQWRLWFNNHQVFEEVNYNIKFYNS